MRRRVSDVLTILILILSAAACNFASRRSARAARATPDKLKCDNLPAAFTGSYQNLTNELVHFGDGACPAGYEHFEYAGLDYADLPVLAMGVGLPPMNRSDAGLEVDETLAADLQCDHDGGRFSKSCTVSARSEIYGLLRVDAGDGHAYASTDLSDRCVES